MKRHKARKYAKEGPTQPHNTVSLQTIQRLLVNIVTNVE